MTMTEYRTMFALWCLVKSPLMLGSDLTKMTKDSEAYGIITNERLLSVNQDKLGNSPVSLTYNTTYFLLEFIHIPSMCMNLRYF